MHWVLALGWHPIAALSLLAAVSAPACPPGAWGHVAGAGKPSQPSYEALYVATLESARKAVRAKLPDAQLSVGSSPGENKIVVKTGSRELATLKFFLSGHELSGNHAVDKDARDCGLSRLMLLAVLKEHPEIDSISDSYTDYNESAFLVAVTGGTGLPDLKKRVREVAEGERAKPELCRKLIDMVHGAHEGGGAKRSRLRRRMFDALLSGVPGGRVNASCGFGRITAIDLAIGRNDSGQLDVALSVSYGKESAESRPEPVIHVTDETGSEVVRYEL